MKNTTTHEFIKCPVLPRNSKNDWKAFLDKCIQAGFKGFAGGGGGGSGGGISVPLHAMNLPLLVLLNDHFQRAEDYKSGLTKLWEKNSLTSSLF